MKNKEQIEITGDNHFSKSIKTPLRADAFDKTDDEKYGYKKSVPKAP